MARGRPIHHRRPHDDHHLPLPPAHRPCVRVSQPRRVRAARRGPPGLPAGLIRPARGVPRARTPRSSSMTYFEGFIVAVPEANRDAYLAHAREFAPMFQQVGVTRVVETWESDVPEGKVTDFRKAVDAKPDEKIVVSWFEYPSKQERDAANEKMMNDPRMKEMSASDMPFDAKRMIIG